MNDPHDDGFQFLWPEEFQRDPDEDKRSSTGAIVWALIGFALVAGLILAL